MSMSGWCPAFSASAATRLTNPNAVTKSSNLKVRTSSPLSIFQSGRVARSEAACSTESAAMVSSNGRSAGRLAGADLQPNEPALDFRRVGQGSNVEGGESLVLAGDLGAELVPQLVGDLEKDFDHGGIELRSGTSQNLFAGGIEAFGFAIGAVAGDRVQGVGHG